MDGLSMYLSNHPSDLKTNCIIVFSVIDLVGVAAFSKCFDEISIFHSLSTRSLTTALTVYIRDQESEMLAKHLSSAGRNLITAFLVVVSQDQFQSKKPGPGICKNFEFGAKAKSYSNGIRGVVCPPYQRAPQGRRAQWIAVWGFCGPHQQFAYLTSGA